MVGGGGRMRALPPHPSQFGLYVVLLRFWGEMLIILSFNPCSSAPPPQNMWGLLTFTHCPPCLHKIYIPPANEYGAHLTDSRTLCECLNISADIFAQFQYCFMSGYLLPISVYVDQQYDCLNLLAFSVSGSLLILLIFQLMFVYTNLSW